MVRDRAWVPDELRVCSPGRSLEDERISHPRVPKSSRLTSFGFCASPAIRNNTLTLSSVVYWPGARSASSVSMTRCLNYLSVDDERVFGQVSVGTLADGSDRAAR